MASSIVSKATNIKTLDNVSYEFVWTGSPVGTFYLEVSLDHEEDSFGNVTVPGNWARPVFLPTPDTSLGSPIILEIDGLSTPWVRLAYDRTSGTGTLDAYIAAKMT